MDGAEAPHVDERSVAISASPDLVWAALIRAVGGAFSGVRVELVARALGCAPAAASGFPEVAGSRLAGFRVETAQRPVLLTLAGHHRFSCYALLFRVEARDGRTWCRAETRARFPGWRGQLYRAAVLGTGGHRFVVARMLRTIKHLAERAAGWQDEFRAREECLWRAETRFDRAFMQQVLHPEFAEFGRAGRVHAREQVVAAEPVPLDVELRDVAVHRVADAVVLVTYLSVDRRGDQALTGRRSSLWVRQNGAWLLRFHHGTPR